MGSKHDPSMREHGLRQDSVFQMHDPYDLIDVHDLHIDQMVMRISKHVFHDLGQFSIDFDAMECDQLPRRALQSSIN